MRLVYLVPRIQISRIWSFTLVFNFLFFPQVFVQMTTTLLPRALQMNLKCDPKIEICIFVVDIITIKILIILNLVQCLVLYFQMFSISTRIEFSWIVNWVFNMEILNASSRSPMSRDFALPSGYPKVELVSF